MKKFDTKYFQSLTEYGDRYIREVDLVDADLTNQQLFDYSFSDKDLRLADFSGSDLTAGSFNRCNLHTTNLSNTNLQEASFIGAYFKNVDLTGAYLGYVTGNGREIISKDIEDTWVVYTKDILCIESNQYSIAEWRVFSNEIIKTMPDISVFWWNKHKEYILDEVKASRKTG